MAASTASIPGGYSFNVPNSQEQAAIQSVINSLGAGDTKGALLSDPSLGLTSKNGTFVAYALTPNEGDSYTLTPGENVASLQGTLPNEDNNDASLTGADSTSPFLLVGNEGNDTITTGSSSTGNVFVGDGNNTVHVASGTNVTITAGHGVNNITAAGNDTITLGTGADTLTATGAATVHGGSGKESITGGSGSFTFFGSTSSNASDTVVGGSGSNFFEGGAGSDTLVSGASKGGTDMFEFSSTTADSGADSIYSGGAHNITGFTSGKDVIDLHGYSSGDIVKDTFAGGSTTIQLDDGTSITVDSKLSSSDIKFT